MPGYVFVADDFTGASDTLATLAEGGLNVRLFLKPPTAEEAAGLDAVGIATDLRARPSQEIAARLNRLAPTIRSFAPRVVHYKICSTFDSAPHVGNIGAAVLALETALRPSGTIIVGGQPSLGRHCIFGTLFARAPDGLVYRIDRHPVMSVHPVTPMGEADLRIHLRNQGLDDVGLVSHVQLQAGAQDGPTEELRRGGRILVDAVGQSDIERLAELLHSSNAVTAAPLLIVGASSVAEALYPAVAVLASPASAVQASGPRLAVAGSRSSTTAAQVAAAASYERLPLGRDDLETGEPEIARRSAELLAGGRNVLLHLKPNLDYGLPAAALSERLAELTASIVDLHQVSAIAVAGGDTASSVVERLGFGSLSFVQRAGAGVAICCGHIAGQPLDGTLLLLKGGQVGAPDLFERFAAGG